MRKTVIDMKRTESEELIARYVYNPDNILKCENCPFNIGRRYTHGTGCHVAAENCWIKLYCNRDI